MDIYKDKGDTPTGERLNKNLETIQRTIAYLQSQIDSQQRQIDILAERLTRKCLTDRIRILEKENDELRRTF